jgi:hypothetical protein
VEEARTRIKITVGDATIEVEGSQDYVEKKLKEPQSFGGLAKQVAGMVPAIPAKVEAKGQEAKATKGKKKAAAKGIESHNLVTDLDLSGTDTVSALKDFYKEKKPASAQECNVVFIYYLKKMLKIDKVGIEHVYTCYKAVGTKVPGRLYQNLLDTRKVKGWIITENMDDLRIGTLGENFVEKELPKPQQSK